MGWGLAASIVLSGAAALNAPAQDQAAPPPRVGTLIDELGDASYQTRQHATVALESMRSLTLDAIEQLAVRGGLAAEQRYRLMRVGWSRFRTEPRAGMGISFGAAADRGVRLERTIQGFHAAEVLAPGDIILQADGQEVNQRSDLQSAILSHTPGETMTLRVLRGTTESRVEVRLGSYGDLNNGGYQLPEPILRAAWNFRRRILLDQAMPGPTIDCRAEPTQIPTPEAMGPPTRGQWDHASESVVLERWAGSGSGLIAGGQSRGGVDESGRVRVRLAGRDASLPETDRTGQPVPVTASAREQLRAIIDDLSLQNSMIVADLVETRRRLADRSTTAEQRVQLNARHQRLTEAAAAIDAELRRLAGIEADPALDEPR